MTSSGSGTSREWAGATRTTRNVSCRLQAGPSPAASRDLQQCRVQNGIAVVQARDCTIGDDLSANTVTLPALNQAEIDVIFLAGHETVYDDDGLVRLVIDADVDSFPRRGIDINGEALCEHF